MQLSPVGSPVQNNTPDTVASALTSAAAPAPPREVDAFETAPVKRTAAHPALALLSGALGRPLAAPRSGASPEEAIEQAKHQFAVGHQRQGLDFILRAIDADRYSTDACLAALWDEPMLTQLPNLLRHVLSRFDAQDPAYRVYQWFSVLAFHAKGSRQMGLRLLGKAINELSPGKAGHIGSAQVPTTDHWLRQHDMANVSQADFWAGCEAGTTVGAGIHAARRQLIDALSLADAHLEDTLPLVKAFAGSDRDVLAELSAGQTLRLLQLHARREPGLVLDDDEVRAMVAVLSAQQRLDHLGQALLVGNAFHVSELLEAGAKLQDVPPQLINSRTCEDPAIVEALMDAGMSAVRVAEIITQRGIAEPSSVLPVRSLEVLLVRQFSPDTRLGGETNGPTLLWEAIRRKDAASVTLLRSYDADFNLPMRVTHADGSVGFTTAALAALAQGDAQVMQAMRIETPEAMMPGVRTLLEAVGSLRQRK